MARQPGRASESAATRGTAPRVDGDARAGDRPPAVSIVVPTFRRPHFLRGALASALAQSERDLEVLVCDNGGDAETAAVVAGAADPRVVHVVRPRNLGMVRNAVDGFLRARGEFVMKLDDDDRLHADAVKRLLTAARHPGVTLAFAPIDLVDDAGRPLPERTRANELHSGRATLAEGVHRPFDRLVARGTVALACALVRRDAVDWPEVPDDVATAYDRHIALQAARDGAAAWFVPTPLADYRIHPGSDTARHFTRQSLGSLRAMEHAWHAGRHVDRGALLDGLQTSTVPAARQLLREGEVGAARDVLWRALRRRPDRELWPLVALSLLPDPLAVRVARHRQERARRLEEGKRTRAGSDDALVSAAPSSWGPRSSSGCRGGGSP